MKTVYDTIVACRDTSSKNEKLAILKAQSTNLDLKEFLRVTYEPRINFYMKKIESKFASTNVLTIPFDLNAISDILRKVAGRELTGHDAKMYIANMHKGFAHDWERELLTMLIERDVRAGFSDSTTNKVWAGLVTDVPYMRCCLPKDAKLDRFDWELGVISQIKADGMFANINHEVDGRVTIMSRNGSPFPVDHPAFAALIQEVREHIPRGNQLHGELLMFLDCKMLPRQEGNGKFNTLLQGGDLDYGTFAVAYECWDMIPAFAAYAKNKYTTPYHERFETLSGFLGQSERTALWLIETRKVHSLKEAYEHYRDALDRGLEGTIIKEGTMPWEDTTSKWQVKLKLEFECDLKITGFKEGRGKYVGMLGSFECESSDGKLQVNVSGLTDAQRKEYWEDREQLLGKILTVKSNSIMPPTRTEFYSLFLPVMVEIRLDKREADSVERVQDQYEAAIASITGG
jgi:DNA ligase-1